MMNNVLRSHGLIINFNFYPRKYYDTVFGLVFNGCTLPLIRCLSSACETFLVQSFNFPVVVVVERTGPRIRIWEIKTMEKPRD